MSVASAGPSPSMCSPRPSTSSRCSPSAKSTKQQWTPMESGPSGGATPLLALLQKTFCGASAQYRTVLARESLDSGLELDDLERRSRKRDGQQTAEGTRGEAEAETEEDRATREEEEEEGKKRRSLAGRLLSALFVASSSPSPSEEKSGGTQSMFDFPSMDSPFPGDGFASPVTQLSSANAVLMHENERLANRVRDLELTLHDHVAHLNSIYHTLHHKHGFQALQLPDGELVHLSRFKGLQLNFVRGKGTDRSQLQQSNGAVPQSMVSSTSGSSSSFASSSADVEQLAELPLAMMRRLCIRPMAGNDGEQIQAFMDWLKSGDSEEAADTWAGRQGSSQHMLPKELRVAALRELGRGVHFRSVDVEATREKSARQLGWRTARSETGGGTIAESDQQPGTSSSALAAARSGSPRTHVYSVMNKNPRNRPRTHHASLSSRHRSAPLASAGHHSSFCSPRFLANSSPPAEERSPRRGAGIGITNMGHRASTSKLMDKNKRNLI